MAKDPIIPIIILIVIVGGLLFGSQFGLFAIFNDIKDVVEIDALGHRWKGTNIGQDQRNEYYRANLLSASPTLLRISNEVNPIKITTNIETLMTLTLLDVNIKELDGLKIFSTTSGNGRARGSGVMTMVLKDELGNRIELAGIAGGGGQSASTWGWGGIKLEISRDKKTVTSFIGESVAKVSDVSSLTGNLWNLETIFAVKADGSFGGVTQNTVFTLVKIEKFLAPIPQPPKPSFKPTNSFMSNIQPKVKSLFGIQSLFAITGVSSTQTGQESSYSATRSVIIDNDFSDETFTYQYGNYILANKEGNILVEGSWEEIPNGVYNKDFKVTINQAGEYVLATVIQQHTMNYDLSTGQWAVINENLIFDDNPLKLTVTGTTTTTPTTNTTTGTTPTTNTTTGTTPTTTQPVITTSSGSLPTSSPTITSLNVTKIPEQKIVAPTSNTKLIIVAVLFAIGLSYLLFRKD